ncbi:family 16 glycoside hydrolase [Cryphonectria parasitica EP155]|uniref:Family 16 glycoside hydrolase n=1 Tax=Cryphonectria parasitica (strain ATCC 38755 / EP155) TaxID=660469 RepID=A0A9P4Y597_CRYP1|nr:family 16 glycoside hydrolase [Cryphonectria parasitica EP155]KAF3767214.1 family 16 glycoside hydrolase [Cryphonectria parasitica EP155]
MARPSTALVLALVSLVAGWAPPGYSGFTEVWGADFPYAAGVAPDANNWNIITGYLNVNGEWEEYTSSSANVQCSGGQTLQLVPWKDSSTQNGWTSGRIESKYTFTPTARKVTRAEAEIRFGTNDISTKQGIWPAFWMLGDSLRHGGSWPACGELDVLETVDGILTGYGTAHCGTYPGGVCNEGTGIGSHIAIPDQSWHVWRVEWDRTSNNWETETIKWSMDGIVFQTLTGSQLTQAIWTSLCHSPLYFILNVAVGGSWPGYPNSATLDGYGAMMEVGYVAQYISN